MLKLLTLTFQFYCSLDILPFMYETAFFLFIKNNKAQVLVFVSVVSSLCLLRMTAKLEVNFIHIKRVNDSKHMKQNNPLGNLNSGRSPESEAH